MGFDLEELFGFVHTTLLDVATNRGSQARDSPVACARRKSGSDCCYRRECQTVATPSLSAPSALGAPFS